MSCRKRLHASCWRRPAVLLAPVNLQTSPQQQVVQQIDQAGWQESGVHDMSSEAVHTTDTPGAAHA